MVKSAPAWLNLEFLTKHIRESLTNPNISVKSFEAKPIADDESDRDLHLIVKTTLDLNGAAHAQLAQLNVFDKEMKFYEKIAPKINNLFIEAGEQDQVLPRAYGVAIILDDLKVSGYIRTNIREGVGFEDAKAIFEKVAKLHAACAVLQEREPDIFANFGHGLFNRATDANDAFYFRLYDCLLDQVCSMPELDVYARNLQAMRSKLISKGQETFDANPNEFNTLIHGDLHLNNLLVKYSSENQIENVVAYDFAISCWSSAAVDLQYFLNLSVTDSVRPRKYDELLVAYHESLKSFLSRLGYKNPIPTLDELKKQFYAKSFIGFFSSCLFQPIGLSKDIEGADLGAYSGADQKADAFRKIVFSSPGARDLFKRIIPYFDQFGVFDI